MVVLTCLAFLFIYRGSYLLDDYFYQPIVRGLPPKARAAFDAVNQSRMPDPDGFKELLAMWPERVAPFQRQQQIDLFALFGATCILVVGAAYLVAAKLAAPIERVAVGVRRLAAGNLSTRIGSERDWGREAQSLVDDFNELAASLAGAQRALREGNAAIAHELRTPLTVLRGRLQGMLDGVFGHSPSDIKRLILQIDALTGIVDDLRVLSLAAVAELKVELNAIDLAVQAEDVLALVEADLDAAGITVECDLRPAPMNGDGNRIRQAILALIDNARRYGASGKIIAVETGISGDVVLLRVRDAGPGFPAGAEVRAFEPFWRADPSRSRGAGGSGLGLAVVNAIVDAHRGQAMIGRNEPSGASVELRFALRTPAL
jgi:two-component system sensor histidine kinase AdeS